MNTNPSCSHDSPPPSRLRLAQLVHFEHRSLVMRRHGLTAEWRSLEWTADAVLWAGMERTYRDVCDLELMRIDTDRTTDHRTADRTRHHRVNGQRS